MRKRLPVAKALIGQGDRQVQEEEQTHAPLDETAVEMLERLTGENLLRCPRCRTGQMERHPLRDPDARGPPRWVA